MTDTSKPKSDGDLDALFDLARAEKPEADAGLLARVQMDADWVLAGRARPVPAPRRRFAGIFAAFGGWPAAAGMAAATLAGVWIGIDPPASVSALGVDFLSDQSDAYFGELYPDLTQALSEG
ncbi:hypothetical protein [Aliiroseovarius sp. YM-037]|uniref:hypothetical protein n=1 Tax=Aliiroseovarius sp. YM-037 TaxID=3341728 RepID=UPI003A80267C